MNKGSINRKYTAAEYYKAVRLYSEIQDRRRKLLSLRIPTGTLCMWTTGKNKPRCISEKIKNVNKERYKNLGILAEKLNIFPERLTAKEKAYLLGVYIGDGNSYTGFDQISIDYDFAHYVAQLLTKMCGVDIRPKRYTRKHKNRKDEVGYRVRVHRRNLKYWLEEKTDNKYKIPTLITDKEKYWFFSGFFDSEGTVKYSGIKTKDMEYAGIGTSAYLSICQKDGDLIYLLKQLLKKININSNIRAENGYFYMKIFNKDNFKKILKYGNIMIERKREKIEEYAFRKYQRTEKHKKNLSISQIKNHIPKGTKQIGK